MNRDVRSEAHLHSRDILAPRRFSTIAWRILVSHRHAFFTRTQKYFWKYFAINGSNNFHFNHRKSWRWIVRFIRRCKWIRAFGIYRARSSHRFRCFIILILLSRKSRSHVTKIMDETERFFMLDQNFSSLAAVFSKISHQLFIQKSPHTWIHKISYTSVQKFVKLSLLWLLLFMKKLLLGWTRKKVTWSVHKDVILEIR